MRFSKRTPAILVMLVASLLVPWTAMAAPAPQVVGVTEADAANGAGRVLLVFGTRLRRVASFELRTATNDHVADLPVMDRSDAFALLALPGDPAPGDYALVYSSNHAHDGVAVVRLTARAESPLPPPVPGPHDHDGTYLRLTGGDTVSGTIRVTTASNALVATSGVTETMGGSIDSTASHGVAIAGHGDVGVFGDVDSDGTYGVMGRCGGADQVGVFGYANAEGGTGVFGSAVRSTGVEGGSCAGFGVYGYTLAGGSNSYYMYYGCTGTDAAGVKAVSKGENGTALLAEAQGVSSTALLVNHTGGSGDLAVFRTDGTNCARIALDGTGYFNGGTVSSGADFAESVAVDAPSKDFEPGDVVVIDPSAARRFSLCRTANSPLVAGVVSTRPALLGSVHDVSGAGRDALDEEVRLGIVGIVPTKVCDEGGPIAIGDLLVSASRPGTAKKAPDRPVVGTVLGKALGALAQGTGKVEVLLMQR